jgi:hypothetical protein
MVISYGDNHSTVIHNLQSRISMRQKIHLKDTSLILPSLLPRRSDSSQCRHLYHNAAQATRYTW